MWNYYYELECGVLHSLHSSPSGLTLWAFVPFPIIFQIWFTLATLGGSIFKKKSDQILCQACWLPSHFRLLCMHPHACRIVKIVGNIHWILLSNFHFLHQPHVLHCLKAITKYRNVHTHFCVVCEYMLILLPNFFWCILDTFLTILQSFKKIWVMSYEGLFTAPSFVHVSTCICMHAHTHP